MNRTKIVVIGGFMASLAAIFQALPVLLSEAAVILTILSAVPIYTSSRIKPIVGVLSYLVAAVLILLVSAHEAMFFLCTNGIIGVTFGSCRYYKQKKLITLFISSLSMTISLSFMNYIIGIPVFGVAIPGAIVVQIIILFLFSFIYGFLYLLFADFIYKRISKLLITEGDL
jgi:hypothetical protein